MKKLDKKTKRPAIIFGYSFGILMTLMLGIGMCFSMNILGDASVRTMIMGIIIGVFGIAGASINYPIYQRLLCKRKEKYAYEIIQLAKEISEGV